jgi:hypothetical protein
MFLTWRFAMSDGPFKSLKMRKGWQDLGDRAANSNFDPAEICNALPAALKADFDEEVLPQLLADLRRVLANADQGSLFGDQGTAELVGLKREAAGRPLAALSVECAIQTMGEERTGEAALVEAVSNALAEWCARNARGIEEHALRENLDLERRHYIRHRIENAICGTPFDDLARQLLRIDAAAPPRTPPKQGDLDDGVPIDDGR